MSILSNHNEKKTNQPCVIPVISGITVINYLQKPSNLVSILPTVLDTFSNLMSQ